MTTTPAAVALDRYLGDSVPVLADDAAVAAIERIPLTERLTALNTLDALKVGAALDPTAAALKFLPNADPDETPLVITHAQFVSRVIQAANLFHSLGVRPGDAVTLLLPLVPQHFFALFGAEAAGIANPVNPMLEPAQLAGILKAANTKVLVALGPMPGVDIWSKVMAIRGQLPALQTILTVGAPVTDDASVRNFDSALAAQPDDRLISDRQIGPDDIAAYFHTGGTTGTPKLVPHTHLNQVYQAWAMNLMLPLPPGDNLLFGLPLFHVGGALTQGLSTLTKGGTLVILSAAGWRNPSAIANVWRLVARYRPAVFGGVPTVLTAAIGVPFDPAGLDFLRATSGGGSAIPVAIGRQLQDKLRRPVIEVYGMTETASVHTLAYLDRPIRLGSVGHPVPFSRVRVIRQDSDGRPGNDCAVDEIGVIAMSGPGVFKGYLDEAHNRDAFIEPGWVNSGDLGRRDAQGYIWITGRAKDLIIRGGHNIDPAVVEEAFYQHPAVALVAVVGQPDPQLGEKPLAYVQLKAGMQAEPATLLDHVRERTNERAAVPVDVIFIDAIPLTGVGKVFKPDLRRDAARRVFAQRLAAIAQPELAFQVEVVPHGTHGSIARVTVGADMTRDADQRARLTRQIDEALDPFAFAHTIIWS